VTRRFYLARAPRPSPGRAKDRRSRPSPIGLLEAEVASHRHEVRDDAPAPSALPTLARRAERTRPRVRRICAIAYAERASPVLDLNGALLPPLRAALIGRRGPSSATTYSDGSELQAAISRRRSVASAESTISRRSRHYARQHPTRRAPTAEQRARHQPPRSPRPLRSRRAPRVQGGVVPLCRDLAGCGARSLRLWHSSSRTLPLPHAPRRAGRGKRQAHGRRRLGVSPGPPRDLRRSTKRACRARSRAPPGALRRDGRSQLRSRARQGRVAAVRCGSTPGPAPRPIARACRLVRLGEHEQLG